MKSVIVYKTNKYENYYITLQRAGTISQIGYCIIYEYENLLEHTQMKFSVELNPLQAFKTLWFYRHKLGYKRHTFFESEKEK